MHALTTPQIGTHAVRSENSHDDRDVHVCDDPYQIRLLHFLYLLQAPSLLITLINMFLEFGKSPGVVYVNGTVQAIPKPEYSVFGPSSQLAEDQVCRNMFRIIKLKHRYYYTCGHYL